MCCVTCCLQRQAELKEGGYDAEMLEEVGRGSLDEIRGTIKKLPPITFVDGQVHTPPNH